MKRKHALITAGLSAIAGAVSFGAAAGVAHADPTTTWNGSTETREEDRRFHVNGRLQYDFAYTDADCANAACTGTNESGLRSYARRAFLGVDGRLTSNWRYNAKLDFALALTGNGASVRADDLYLEYAGQDFSFIIGNNNAVSPMEDRDSSLNIPFNERSFLISASGVGKRPGVAFITNGGNWSWGAALASNDTLDTGDNAANGAESYFVAGRFTWAPIFEQTPDGTTVLHLGVYGRYRDNGGGNGNVLNAALGSYSPNPLSAKSNNNAGVGSAETDVFYDGEVAFQWNTFGVEAEYGHMDASAIVGGSQLGDADWNGYYIDVFWSPTGESRRYSASDGSFGPITPRRTLGSDGGIGHIMLSARYEDIDLTDTNFGGNANETEAWTLGATWVPVAHVKFQMNYAQTDVDYENRVGHVDNAIDSATFRTQFDW